MISRRDLLRQSTLDVTGSNGAGLSGPDVHAPPSRNTSARILVIIQLDGGNDGINTVVPYKDEGYKKNRRDLRLAADRADQARRASRHRAESRDGTVSQAIRGRPTRHHSGRRLSQPQPLSFRVDGDLAVGADDSRGAATATAGSDGASTRPRGRPHGAPAAIFLARSELPLAIRGRRAWPRR